MKCDVGFSLTRSMKNNTCNDQLIMVAVLVRHGERAPITKYLYPNSANKCNDFYPVGESNLTNVGKRQLYEVGKKLRKRYDSFLGPYFIGNEVKILTSTLERTQTSALALCAGLFPPCDKQIWNTDLMWQPIPYTEIKQINDCVIRSPTTAFPVYAKLYDAVLESDFNKNLLKKYSRELDLFKTHAGYENPSIRDAYFLYFSLEAEKNMGLPLPDWTKDVFPEKLEEISVFEYDLSTLTTPLKQYAGGGLAKVLTDVFREKVNNKTILKCLIISGHECTIGYQLRLLDIEDHFVPRYGSHLIWELYQTENNYKIKILYENFYGPEPVQCLCMPYENFLSKMKPYFPSWEIIID